MTIGTPTLGAPRGPDTFSGNGSTTQFTLSHAPGAAHMILAAVEGIVQQPAEAFTVSGTTLTFTGAPPSGTNNVKVWYLGGQMAIGTPGDGTVDGAKIALGSDAQGDVMYYNGSAWARLGAGTAGQVLQTQGAGANPTWGGGGSMTLIESLTASTDATVDFTTGLTDHDTLIVSFEKVVPGTDGVEFRMRVSEDAGSTWKSGASDYYNMTTSANHMTLSRNSNVGGDTGECVGGQVVISSLSSGSYLTIAKNVAFMNTSGQAAQDEQGAAYVGSTNAVDGIQFFFSSGNVESGRISVFGMKTS